MGSRVLADIADIEMGQSPPGAACNESCVGLPLLNGPTEFGGHHPAPTQYTTDARKRAHPGDLLFCVRGSTTGRMNWADREYAVGRGIAAVRHKTDPEIQPFIRAAIEVALPVLLAAATGSTFPNVSRPQLAAIPVPDISPDEQRRIASILGALDDKIELNRRMSQTLDETAQAIFKSWFIDAAGSGIPRGWRHATLGAVTRRIFSGGTPDTRRPEYWGGSLPWLSSGETRQRFITGTEKTITEAGVRGSSTRIASMGSTVIASAGQGHTRGQASLLLIDTYVNQSVVVVEADEAVLPSAYVFLDLARRYEAFRQLSDAHSSRGSLTTKLIAGIDVLLPPNDTLRKFESAVASMLQRIRICEEQSRYLGITRDALLPRLLNGNYRTVGSRDSR